MRETPDFKPVEFITLGQGYSLALEPALSYGWYSASVYFCTADDGKLVRIAYATVKKNQWRTVRWAKRKKRIHRRALELAAREAAA